MFDNLPINIAVDNCCSNCISNDACDFIALHPYTSHASIQGIGGSISITRVGTIIWYITDDEGKLHKFEIHYVWLSEDALLHLLCPQQLAAQQAALFPNSGIFTGATASKFWFNGAQKTIAHTPGSNIPVIHAGASQHHFAD